jgi:proteasome lid subunit RPN8/RPN11
MLTIPVIESCPHTVTGRGKLTIAHTILATFAGAVYEREEWMALLLGTRDESGLNINVTGIRVPLQQRSVGNCKLVKEEELTPDIVGVVHSHHSMGAFFSVTDHDTLNPRFPMSIVVAQPKVNESQVERLLGFTYKAEGRVVLPCGSIGIVSFTVLPDPVLEAWPETVTGAFRIPHLNTALDECPHTTRTRVQLMDTCTTTCGIVRTEPADTLFGRESTEFVKEVEKMTKGYNFQKGDYWDRSTNWVNRIPDNPYQSLVVVDNRQHGKKKDKSLRTLTREEGYFYRGWGEYGDD